MKKRMFNPGFEFIFTLAILAVFGLPPLVMAQDNKDTQISIVNGDTTINGKNIKDLSPKDRQAAMADINNIKMISPDNVRKGTAGLPRDKTYSMQMKSYHNGVKDSAMVYSYRNDNGGPKMALRPPHNDMRARIRDDRNPAFDFDRKNSQVFNFVTTDNNSVSTRVSYRVSEPTDGLTHMGIDPDQKDQHEKLDMTDLNIIPQFSAGKTMIMFDLPTKAVADVQFEDGKGNLLWQAKAVNGSFMKSFAMGLNGIYYLRVEQKGHLAVKKIFKEQM